jgi:hypothetical protein
MADTIRILLRLAFFAALGAWARWMQIDLPYHLDLVFLAVILVLTSLPPYRPVQKRDERISH